MSFKNILSNIWVYATSYQAALVTYVDNGKDVRMEFKLSNQQEVTNLRTDIACWLIIEDLSEIVDLTQSYIYLYITIKIADE